MADDGSFKGHGGKPGRKSTVVSMSAHKNRHLTEAEKTSKKLAGLTIFDLDQEEFDPVEDASPARAATTAPGKARQAASRKNAAQADGEGATGPASGAISGAAGEIDALPCENTPFEHNISAEENNPATAPARRFLRWGLEDGGVGGDLMVRDLFEDVDGPELAGGGPYSGDDLDKKIERWQKKAGRSESVIESFYHAFQGMKVGFAGQRNIRIHCCIAITVLIMALAVRLDTVSWLALILATGFVFFAEFINTAVEHVTDIQASFRYHPSARFAKDTAAAAVLVAAMTAVLVGVVVFGPHVLALLSGQSPFGQ